VDADRIANVNEDSPTHGVLDAEGLELAPIGRGIAFCRVSRRLTHGPGIG